MMPHIPQFTAAIETWVNGRQSHCIKERTKVNQQQRIKLKKLTLNVFSGYVAMALWVY